MKSKKYSGYRSYQYLDAEDYRQFAMAPEIGRVPPYELDLSEEQRERAERLLADSLVVSLHEHLSVMPEDISELREYERQGREVTGYEGVKVSGMDAVFENFMDGTCTITSSAGWKWTDVLHDVGMRLCDLAHQDMIIRAEGLRDIHRAAETGRVALIPALESATPVENEIDRIDVLYGLGIRMLGICYSEANMLGSGQREPVDGGLTYFGRRAVDRMNRLGMAIDISHASDRTCMDVIRRSRHPVFISHTGARALWNSRGMKPDEVLTACAERGGVIGIMAAPHTTLTEENPRHNIESVMEHFTYCVDLVGIDSVAFGPDTLFGDHVDIHRQYSRQMSIEESRRDVTYEEVDYVAGLENPSECFPNITRWLVKHGYSDDEIGKVLGDNIVRALAQVWVS